VVNIVTMIEMIDALMTHIKLLIAWPILNCSWLQHR